MGCSGSYHLPIIYCHMHGLLLSLQSIIVAVIYLDLHKNLAHSDIVISILQIQRMRLSEGLGSRSHDHPGSFSPQLSISLHNIPPRAIPSLPTTLSVLLDPLLMCKGSEWLLHPRTTRKSPDTSRVSHNSTRF